MRSPNPQAPTEAEGIRGTANDLADDPEALLALLDRLAAATPAERRQDAGSPRVVRAPGRVNLIGEHTDYNDGLVLPAAIDLQIAIGFVPTSDRSVDLTLAATGERAVVDLDAIGPPRGGWRDYVAATAWALGEAGAPIQGFRGVLASSLPAGAGLSSSAALELAVAWALGGGEAPLADRMDLARTAQRAENEYVGVPCGLMDQFAVAFGVQDAAVMLDCRSLEHRVVRISSEAALLVADSGVPRGLRTSAYADRRAECRRAVELIASREPSVTSLRDVTPELLDGAKRDLDGPAWRRARHVIAENARVEATVAALEQGDLDAAGGLFLASHASLRDDYEVSSPELDRLVELAAATPGVFGARLTGAGFGGATVNLVQAAAVDDVVAALTDGYRTPEGERPVVRRVMPSAGAGVAAPRGTAGRYR